MAIEDVLRALHEEGETQCRSIAEDAETECERIEEEAARRADAVRLAIAEQAERAARADAARMLEEVRAAHKNEAARFREQALDEVFDEVLRQVAQLRDDQRYRGLFRALADEAMQGVDCDVEFHVDPADEQLALHVAEEYPCSIQVVPSLSSIGGLVVRYHAGRVERRNTIEDRLAKARTVLRSEAAELLFS